jgi:6-phosphogluconolactonase (cycloisomerase 2 family)
MQADGAAIGLAAAWLVAITPLPSQAGIGLEAVQTLFDATGLGGTTAVVVTPDGRHVYAAGQTDDAVAGWLRDPESGRLSPVQVVRDGVGGVDGLQRVLSLAVSPDGAHVYAVGAGEGALAVLARDATTGVLTPVEVVRDESDLFGAFTGSIAISPDGAHLYVTGFDSFTVLARDRVSGRVTMVETQRVSDGPVRLDGTQTIAVSPDGRHVYVDRFDDALVVYSRDPQSGALSRVGAVPDFAGLVGAIAISPDGRNAYATGFIDDAVAVFDRDADSGMLTVAQIVHNGSGTVRGLDGANGIAIDGAGKQVYVTGFEGSSLAVLARDPTTGRLEPTVAFVDGVGPIDGLQGAIQAAVSPDGAHVYVAALFDEAIAVFGAGAAPQFIAVERSIPDNVDGLRGVRAVALSPDGAHVYAAGVGDRAIAVFARDGGTGQLTFLTTTTPASVVSFNRPSLAFTPDGRHLLSAAFEPGVLVRRREAASGELSLVQRIDESLSDPDVASAVYFASAVASSPDGTQVFVASFFRHSVAVFDRDAASGELRFRMASGNDSEGPKQPTSLVVSRDGRNVYATGSGDDSVVVFRRTDVGGLVRVQDVRDAIDSVFGLRGASAMALSPDDSTLYVVGGGPFGDGGDGLAVFDRNPETGALSFVQAFIDGHDGIDGLAGASAVAVVPDGSAVVVAAPEDDALSLFARDPAGGELTFAGVVRDGHGADGLAGAGSLAVSPGGQYLYVAGADDHALTVLRLVGEGVETCAGDCDDSGSISITELIRCVVLALGGAAAACSVCDTDGGGNVDIADLVRAVDSALHGCTATGS